MNIVANEQLKAYTEPLAPVVHLRLIDQHLGRRSASDYQRSILALRKHEILAAQASRVAAQPAPMKSLDDLAKAARLSSNQVVMIETIQKQATPEVVAAVKSGVISINAAAAVATPPEHEQIAAALGA